MRRLASKHSGLGIEGISMIDTLKKAWRFVRRVSGDDAYERYLQHHAEAHPEHSPLSRKEFFRREQDRKWGGVRRCC